MKSKAANIYGESHSDVCRFFVMGKGAYSFVPCLSRMTIALARRTRFPPNPRRLHLEPLQHLWFRVSLLSTSVAAPVFQGRGRGINDEETEQTSCGTYLVWMCSYETYPIDIRG